MDLAVYHVVGTGHCQHYLESLGRHGSGTSPWDLVTSGQGWLGVSRKWWLDPSLLGIRIRCTLRNVKRGGVGDRKITLPADGRFLSGMLTIANRTGGVLVLGVVYPDRG